MRKVLVSAIGALAMCGPASAGLITQSGSLPMETTNWSESFDIQQFDTMDGSRVLEEVSWTFRGTVEGFANAESLDAAPTEITLNLSAQIAVMMGGGTLEVMNPHVTMVFDAAAFDDSLDFSGPSGASFGPLDHTDQRTGSPADLSPFVGPGMVALTGVATGNSSGAGSGNLATDFSTSASLDWSVTYRFSVIPTPGCGALLGLAGLAAVRRRRRA